MRQGDRLDLPPTNAPRTDDVQRVCYRCAKVESAQRPLRLLPGSQHIIVCPACYQFLWGWKEKEHEP